jgi:hypothetical protein
VRIPAAAQSVWWHMSNLELLCAVLAALLLIAALGTMLPDT